MGKIIKRIFIKLGLCPKCFSRLGKGRTKNIQLHGQYNNLIKLTEHRCRTCNRRWFL